MRTISYRLEDLKKVTIHIGYVGENEHTRVNIDAGEVFAENPDAVVTMKVQPPRGEVYPVTVSREGDIVTWDVKDSDLVSRGAGEIQLTFTEGTEVIKSCIARISIDRSIVGNGTAPDPVQDWVDSANEKLAAVEEATTDAETAAGKIDDMTVAASGSAYGSDPTATITEVEGHKHVAFTIPAGQPGTPGDPTQLIDDTAGTGTTGKTWSADKINTEVSQVKTEITKLPEEKDSTLTGADLDIADDNGNVIASLHDGNIRMKNFSSDNGMYEKRFTYSLTAGTETITHFFPAGTRLAFHLTDYADRDRDGLRSNKVTYKYTDTSGTTRTLGQDYGYNFPEYVLAYDAASVSVQFGNDISYSETTMSFKVYPMASFQRKQNVLTVRASGGKDYTSLRSAVEYAKQYADEINRFEIQIYPGTYDIMSYYTAEEIADEGFVGILISNGIDLVGIGHRSEIILTATLNTSEYDATKRNYVSTINVRGNISIKNLTIKAENIRYAIHDDMNMMAHQNNTHIFERVTMIGKNLTSSNDGELSYGAGGADMKKLFFIDCDFSDALTLHTTTGFQHEYTAYFENCRARLMQFGDYNSGMPCYVYLKNCAVSRIRLAINGAHDQYMIVEGEGVYGAMVESPAGYVYAIDGVHKFAGSNVAAGTAVKLTSDMSEVEASTSLNTLYGISIGVLDDVTYVQTEGWLNSNTLGLSGLSVGDYLTIDGNGAVVSGGTASNAIAVVKHINSNGVAFAKLLI